MTRLYVLVAVWVFGTFNCDASCQDVQLLETVDHAQAWDDVKHLSSDDFEGRKTGTKGSVKAQQYLLKRFKEMRLSFVAGQQSYSVPFSLTEYQNGTNIVGMVRGVIAPEKYIVVTAHYDHIGHYGSTIFNGADDNASGVSAMMAIAFEVAKYPLKHSVIFLATDAEEQGLKGAKAFLKDEVIRISDIRANLNLDMLGQGSRRQTLYVTHSNNYPNKEALLARIQAKTRQCLVYGHNRSLRAGQNKKRIDWLNASDHGAFGEYGIPFIYVGVGEHKDYHKASDEWQRIPKTFFLASVETSYLLLQEIDRHIK
ncbi:M28 family peptidase [Aestuariibacter sp. AA17]|uniref:M28 family peptidase n=1 Tax=Fluctibacter corallii TaxID=2984329 RepID=A0ABT3A832_9ALTE|nr:M28 family peptidase [Aestuariibacter sp. AA17]MCV2884747.1 M28 family peptidase [Aestuariibacter sp. AA17]